MTATSHAIMGTIIAAKIGNPFLSIPIAIGSYILLDMIPHWDTATNRKRKTPKRLYFDTTIDVLLGLALSYLILRLFFPQVNLIYALLIIAASQSLDWLTSLYYFFHIKSFKWAYLFQKSFNRDLNLPWGLINQLITIAVFLVLAKIL